MGWTKRADAVAALAGRRADLRRKLARIDNMQLDVERDEAWAAIFEYEKLDRALARGGRDGIVSTELGISIKHQTYDVGPLVEDLLACERKLTFPVR